jgi:Polyketide cyclase / dehydrase and lipid transport
MASINKHLDLDVDPSTTWEAIRDFPSPHVPFAGVLCDAKMDGDDRVVTFASGVVVRERLVALDDDARRIAYTVVDGPFTHHHATMSVNPTPTGGSRVEWTSDVLPHDVAARVSDLMDQGIRALAANLGEKAT